MKKFDKAIEEHISKIDFSEILPACENVHPLVSDAMDELENADDYNNLWAGRLSDLQLQERMCLSNVIAETLLPTLPPNVQHNIEAYLRPILHYAISAAWIVHETVAKEFGEGQ